ncbi:MAG: hypothetical protein ACXWHJ_12140 [Candidatus Aminicenantales bacterium]
MAMPLMIVSLVLSAALAAWSFCGIAKGYRRSAGLPWLASMIFAVASIAAVFLLHALLSR